MKSVKVVLVLILLLSAIGFSQDYSITDFKADSLTTSQIFVTGSMASDASSDDDSYSKDKQSNNSFTFYPRVMYNYTKNRKKSILNYYASAIYRKTSNSTDQTNYDNNSDAGTYRFLGGADYTKYFVKNLGYSIASSISFESNTQNRSTKSISEQSYINKTDADQDLTYNNFQLAPGIVMGRIYDGKFSAKAMEILNEIKKAGYLKRDLSKSEYLKLSQIILERQESYHYDNRIKKMEALQEIVKYLRDLDAIDNNEVLPILITEDIYSYNLQNSMVPRQDGIRYKLNTILNWSSYSGDSSNDLKQRTYNSTSSQYDLTQQTISKNDITVSGFEKGLELDISYNKIVNWNFCYNFGLNANLANSNEEDIYKLNNTIHYYTPLDTSIISDSKDKEKTDRSQKTISLYSELFYQFDSRSYFEIETEIFYGNQNRERKESGDTDKYIFENYEFIVNPSYTYFFTPKLSISGDINFSLSKYWQSYTQPNVPKPTKNGSFQKRFGFNVSLAYYL